MSHAVALSKPQKEIGKGPGNRTSALAAMPSRNGAPAHHYAIAEAERCLGGSMARHRAWGIQTLGATLGSTYMWRDFLHSEKQTNLLSQWFSQCLLKYLPKCFLVSLLA